MSLGPGYAPRAQGNFRNSPASMPMIARMFRNVPLAMSRPRVDRAALTGYGPTYLSRDNRMLTVWVALRPVS
jgi:hypothetical protein